MLIKKASLNPKEASNPDHAIALWYWAIMGILRRRAIKTNTLRDVHTAVQMAAWENGF